MIRFLKILLGTVGIVLLAFVSLGGPAFCLPPLVGLPVMLVGIAVVLTWGKNFLAWFDKELESR